MYYLYLSSATGDCGIWRDVLRSTIEMRIIFALQKWIPALLWITFFSHQVNEMVMVTFYDVLASMFLSSKSPLRHRFCANR